ncbi:MAG: MinD/ParA family protein [Candidatus Limnocylindrales bacterium]
MATIVSVHSFRGGTGKSNTTANLAAVLASRGQRVGVIDADIQSPGIHVLFGIAGHDVSASLNDFLWGSGELSSIAQDVTDRQAAALPGRMFLIPSSMEPGQIARVLREGYDPQKLTLGLRQVVDALQLDTLLIDTHPGLNEETLLSLVISHTLIVVMRPDQQDYEGTGITVRVAQELRVPKIMLVVNKAPPALDESVIARQVQDAYGLDVTAVIPHSDELMGLASAGVFVLRYPDHPLGRVYARIADAITPVGDRAD